MHFFINVDAFLTDSWKFTPFTASAAIIDANIFQEELNELQRELENVEIKLNELEETKRNIEYKQDIETKFNIKEI